MFNRNTRGIWSWFVEEDISLNNGKHERRIFSLYYPCFSQWDLANLELYKY